MNKITRSILEDLATVRESLLSLSDDIWLSIDHNDTGEMEAGCRFKGVYNSKMVAFDALATEISEVVQKFTNIDLDSSESQSDADVTENDRLVRELKLDQPHKVTEDFTYKRPHGFILKGTAITGVITWKRLYTRFCETLNRLDSDVFSQLPDNEDYVSTHGNHAFATTRDGFIEPISVGDVFTEAHMSANSFRNSMRKLMRTFGIDDGDFDIFLREDRDANRVRQDIS